jgi:hypothetical protein
MVYGKEITYVKDEGFNFNAMTIALKLVISYESFRLEESFQGTFFGHVFPKACRYGTIEEKSRKKSNICKHICKSASLGLKSLEKVDKNGTRLVWKLEFDPKI